MGAHAAYGTECGAVNTKKKDYRENMYMLDARVVYNPTAIIIYTVAINTT